MARVRRRITRREMKEDRFILWLFEAGEYVKTNLQALLIVLAVVVIALTSGYLWSGQRADTFMDAGRLIAPGQTAMQSNRYEDAIPIFERVIAEYGGTASAMEATIQSAKAYFYTNKITEAREMYARYIDEYGGDDELYTLSARAGIAACDEQSGKFSDAATAYLALAEENSESFLAPKFLLDAGRCFQAAEQVDKARALYDRIITSYETTRYAHDAKVALTTL